jgi:hypothetical protein
VDAATPLADAWRRLPRVADRLASAASGYAGTDGTSGPDWAARAGR